MNLILISGLGADKGGNGLISLGIQSKIPYTYFEWDNPNIPIPEGDLIFVGHSLGVWRCLQIIRSLNLAKNLVVYFCMIDGVDKNWKWRENFLLPLIIKKADCFTRDWHFWNFIPPSSDIINADEDYTNHPPIQWGKHASMPSNPIVVARFLNTIKQLG